MLLNKRKKEDPNIDVGAFSDIAFLLIIFFILATTLVQPAGNKVDIPSGSSDPQKNQKKQITVNLQGQDILYGEKNKKLTLNELKAKLLNQDFKSKPEDDRIVILESRTDVPYEVYFQVVMAITNADGIMALIEHEDKKE